MSQLMYSTNDRPILRHEFDQLPEPKALGARHNPYPFNQYLDTIEHSLVDNNIAVLEQEFVVNKENTRMFGLMEIQPAQSPYRDDWRILMGVRGSYDQSIPRGMTLGTQVLVCSNLCFHGNIGTIKTKQTTYIDQRLPQLIHNAIKTIPDYAEHQDQQFTRLKEVEITKESGYLGLVNIYRRRAFTSSQLGHAIREWDNPTNNYGSNLWTLFNCCTEALKPTSGTASMPLLENRSTKISNIINKMAA